MNCSSVNFRMDRREFFGRFGYGLGGAALWSLMARDRVLGATEPSLTAPASSAQIQPLHFPARAKRVIYLFMSGGPSQLDLFDYKPTLNQHQGEDLPDSVRRGQRLTGMTNNQARLPLAGSVFKFKQHGKSGAWISDLLPWTSRLADDLCFVKSMHTEAINHDPAITFSRPARNWQEDPAWEPG